MSDVSGDTSVNLSNGISIDFSVVAGAIPMRLNASGSLLLTTPGNVSTAVLTTDATQTLTNKTLTSPTINTATIDEPVISGTPDAAGEFGRDTTQLAPNWYDNGALGTIPKIVAVGVGTETFTNSTASDQDYTTSIFTIPANSLFTNKCYRVTLWFESITGVASVTITHYLKLGSTKVITQGSSDLTNSITRSGCMQYLIIGRAAAGASANVTTMPMVGAGFLGGTSGTTNQPIALATNGSLAITPGIAWSGTGSTETMELQAWMVEELN